MWATTGAVSQQKIMPKPGGGLTQGHVGLMQFAITSIRDCTGINLELLGQKDINQYPRGSAQASRYDGA